MLDTNYLQTLFYTAFHPLFESSKLAAKVAKYEFRIIWIKQDLNKQSEQI